jgi:hypothetical protein
VKSLAIALYASHPEMLEDQAILGRFALAVRGTGTWLLVRPDLKPDVWTATALAAEEKDSATGIRLKVGGSLDLSPAVTRSFSGFIGQVRVNDSGREFAVGYSLDKGARKILLHDTGELALFESRDGRDQKVGSVVLEARPGPNRWFDLAWVLEGDVLVVYCDDRPVFARRVVGPPPSSLSFTSNLSANFRNLQRRQ